MLSRRRLHVLGTRQPSFLHDKVVGLICAARGTQDLQAINTMAFATRARGAWAVPYVVAIASPARVFDSGGHVQDEGVAVQLRTLGSEVVRVAGRFADDSSLLPNAKGRPSVSRPPEGSK